MTQLWSHVAHRYITERDCGWSSALCDLIEQLSPLLNFMVSNMWLWGHNQPPQRTQVTPLFFSVPGQVTSALQQL